MATDIADVCRVKGTPFDQLMLRTPRTPDSVAVKSCRNATQRSGEEHRLGPAETEPVNTLVACIPVSTLANCQTVLPIKLAPINSAVVNESRTPARTSENREDRFVEELLLPETA
jgi:hypothetical protein